MKSLFIVLSVLLATATAPKHDFHVSITEAEYFPQQELIGISIKLFADDLENALKNQGLKETEYALYFKDKLRFTVNGEKVTPTFLGVEIENELIFAFFEISGVKLPHKLMVENRVFFELFNDQSNIINFTHKGSVSSAFLTVENPEKPLEIINHE